MKCLWDRLFGRRPVGEGASDDQVDASSLKEEARRPRLVFLVHDAVGLAAYKLHTFEDAAAGAAFIQFWFPPRIEHGALAFWAHQREPMGWVGSNEVRPAEAVVLIRDEANRDTVYPFSFPEMGLAHSWIAKEAAKGLSLRLVIAYWATPVRFSTDHWGRVRLTPSQPPAMRRREVPAPPAVAEPVRSAIRSEGASWRRNAAQPEWSDWTPKAPMQKGEVRKRTQADDHTEELTNAARDGDQAQEDEAPEILREAEKVIREERFEERWKQREGPFQGFGSPPGKF